MRRKIIGITVGTSLNPQRLADHVKDGKSAYELAVDNGFKGTEQEWLASLDGKDGYTPVKGKDYFDGEPGKDGYTPVKGKDYFDGEPGKDGHTPVKGKDYFDGEPGKDGEDGYSPTVSVESIDGGHRVTITDKNGDNIFDVMNGVGSSISEEQIKAYIDEVILGGEW